MVKRELRLKSKLLIYLSTYAPALTCAHELWSETEITLWKQTTFSC